MYVLRFNSIEDRDGIIKNGMFFFDKKKKNTVGEAMDGGFPYQ